MGFRRGIGGVGALVAVVLLVAGCAAGQAPPETSRPVVETPLKYVALGDSYTAAPYVQLTDVAGGCLRSDHNYPSLLAQTLKADLTDVSCGGAATRDVTRAQQIRSPMGQASLPPQLRAVTRDTDLVTVGLGGNDGSLFGRLVGACPLQFTPDQPRREGACTTPDVAAAEQTLTRTRADLTRALRLVKQRAPQAEVVLVGYPRLVGERGCAALPIAAADVPAYQQVTERLRDAQAAAAKAAGVTFVDVYAASRGHDVCSERPWVNGIATDTQRALAMHPLLAGERAMARLIEAQRQG